ncbi:MAG: LysR family transcriptional regulator [Pseudomonadota bacterium]
MNLLAAMRYLVALDKHKHFGRAAEASHISQPALSNALRALEEEFGVSIVKRARAYGGLTPEGELVLAAARRTLREMELLTQDLRSDHSAPRGPLRLAAIPTAVPLLSLFAALLRSRHPGVTPVVLAMSSPDIERQLEELTLDLALGYTERQSDQPGRFNRWPLTQERYFFLRRAEGEPALRLRIGAPIRWAEAATKPLCQLTPDMHNRAIVDGALNPGGEPPPPAIETNALLTLVLTVSTGDVCGILPGAMISAVRSHGELEALPLVDPEIRTPIGFLSLADARPSRATQAALDLMQDPEWIALAARQTGDAGY